MTLLCKKHDVSFNEDIRLVFATRGCERCKVEDSYNSAKKTKVGSTSPNEYLSFFKNTLDEIKEGWKRNKADSLQNR